jgi:hypothetical protein
MNTQAHEDRTRGRLRVQKAGPFGAPNGGDQELVCNRWCHVPDPTLTKASHLRLLTALDAGPRRRRLTEMISGATVWRAWERPAWM